MSARAPAPTFPSDVRRWDVRAGALIFRVHKVVDGALWFGPAPGKPPGARFDAPNGEFRVMYGAKDLGGAFAESILRKPGRVVARPFVEARQWSIISCARDLQFAKVFGDGLHGYETHSGISASDSYVKSRRLALAIYKQFDDLDGIAYRSKYDNNELCYAVFDRVDVADFTVHQTTRFAADPDGTNAMMRKYRAEWDRSGPIPPL